MTILIIDDSPANLSLLQAILELKGYNVVSTTCASQALKLAQEHKPELIISDMYMPGELNGLQVLCQIRQDASLRDIPVVITTAGPTETIYQDLLDAGVDELVRLPVLPQTWWEVVANYTALPAHSSHAS